MEEYWAELSAIIVFVDILNWRLLLYFQFLSEFFVIFLSVFLFVQFISILALVQFFSNFNASVKNNLI